MVDLDDESIGPLDTQGLDTAPLSLSNSSEIIITHWDGFKTKNHLAGCGLGTPRTRGAAGIVNNWFRRQGMDKQFCVNCGSALAGGSFCTSCGTAVAMRVGDPRGSVQKLGDRLSAHSSLAQEAIREMKLIGFRNLLPYKDWLRDKPWNLVWVRWLVAVALFPLVLNFAASAAQLSFESIAFVFGMYFALMWAAILCFMLLPNLEFPRIAQVSIFTMVVGIGVVLFVQQLPLVNALYSATDGPWILGRLIGFVAGVGVLEETAKVLPVWWIYVHKKNEDGLGTIVFLGCISGFAFGVAEASKYSISYALGLKTGHMAFGDYLTVQMLRLISLPLLHAIWCGIFSYFVALASVNRYVGKGLLLAGLVIAATLHGLYDTFSDSMIGVAVAVVSILIFIAYYRSGQALQAKMSSILVSQAQST